MTATDGIRSYSYDQLESIYVLLAEAQESLAVGDHNDAHNCITSALRQLGLLEVRP